MAAPQHAEMLNRQAAHMMPLPDYLETEENKEVQVTKDA
jgi:hypothetical protein